MVIFPAGLQAEAVIFDFDGVIVDTEPLHYRAFQRILEPHGLGFSWDKYTQTYMGFDDRDAFLEVFRSHGRVITPEELFTLINEKALVFQEIIKHGITSYPGVIPLIKKLYKAGIPLAICSGALRSDITPILKSLDISECFNIIVTAEDVHKSKPDPECYLLAFTKLREIFPAMLTTNRLTVAIEDTPAGIDSAKASGISVIGVTNSYQKENLTKADLIIDSLEQIIDFSILSPCRS